MRILWRGVSWLGLSLLTTFFGLGAGCNSTSTAAGTAPTSLTFDQQRAWDDLNTQLAFGPRVPGTTAHLKTRDWLAATLKATGAEVQLQPFSHRLGGRDVQMWNVLATCKGTGPAPREVALVVAHWDSRPTADRDPDVAKRTQPVPGANDGASGVAILLELARQLTAHPVARDVLLLFVDGEDYGPEVDNMLLGARYYAAHPSTPKPAWGILLDMVGDADLAIQREPYSDEHAKAVNNRVFAAARRLGYLRIGTAPGFLDAPMSYQITDDHVPLTEEGIPTADLIDFTYAPWHTTDDTAAHCSAESLKVVGRTVLEALAQP